MDQFNTQPPSASTGAPGPARPAGQDSDLYAQISAEDRDVQVVKKKNRSLLLSIIAGFMRATLYIDSLKRTHEPFFHFLGALWTLFMALLYCSGVLMLCFSIYNRMQLPIYLEDQLRLRNVKFESAEYGMDRIVVKNLRDNDNIYTVDSMIIYSTFTDLLQKRIRLVVLDGLNIFIDAKSEPDLLESMPKFLAQVQNPTKGKLDITVNALTVNNAKLTFKNQQVDIPISFSMEGIYGSDTQIVIPLSVDQPGLQADGTLSISGDHAYPEWTLSVSKGKITLPRRAPEDLVGDLKVTLDHQNLDKIQASFKIGYGTIEKRVGATLKKKEGNALSGHITWEKNNLTEPGMSSDLSLQVDDLVFSTQGTLETKGSLIVDSKSFQTPDIGLKKLHVPLDANVVCQNWSQCEVHIKKPVTVTIQELLFPYQRQYVRSREQVQFEVQPQQNALFIQDGEPYLTFDLPIQNLYFKGVVEGTSEKLDVESSRMFVTGSLVDADSDDDTSQVAVKMEDFSYQTPTLSLIDAQLVMDNMLQSTSKTQLRAGEARFTEVPLLSQPFALALNMVGNQASAVMDFKELPIKLQLEGQFMLAQKAFSGKIFAAPFNIQDVKVPLHTLWPNIPSDFKNYTGQVALKGQVTWLGMHNISGPLQIGLKDISFDTNQTRVEGVNAVITADTVVPFTAANTQRLFIQSIDSLIPFQDIDVSFQADAQNLKINRFSVLGAGLPLVLPSSVVSTKSANLLYLKNETPITPAMFEKVMNIPDIAISAGSASLSIPVEIQENSLTIPNITMKVQNVLLQRQSEKYQNVFGTAKNYFVRTGQIIMDEQKVLQLALNGRLLPSKKQQEIQLNAVSLPKSFFRAVPPKAVPQDIAKELKVMFPN